MSAATPATIASSGSTLWAAASKEWVIQPKPKPGRKPKKDPAPAAKEEDEIEAKGRRVQNRAAQRAFRERKQSQLAELQARIQQYEQGEIERNVALQSIAKRLKEDNDSLRRENAILKEKVSKIEKEQQLALDKKRWRDGSPSSVTSAKGPARKKSRLSLDTQFDKSLSASFVPSPPSMVNSPGSTSTSDTRFSPVYEINPSDQTHGIMTNMDDIDNTPKSISLDPHGSFPTFDCGFCSEDTPCVCRELAAQQAADRTGLATFKSEDYTPPIVMTSNRVVHLEPAPQSPPPSRSSILENSPAYQPPVPLRRRATSGMANSIFPVRVMEPETQPITVSPLPTCSGDPSNCLACADDTFGKAFCSAIEKTVAARPPCIDCPSRDSSSSRGCCENRTNCDRCFSTGSAPSQTSHDTSETMPTNDAWRQIKSHPNVSFADLSLLANVVASRSKCTAPRIILSPHPEPKPTPPLPPAPLRDNETIILTDPHAQYREREKAQLLGGASPPCLAPRDTAQCERHRIREVPTSAVQDVLRLLDGEFS